MNIELLKNLSEVHGIPGREEAVRALVTERLKTVTDEMEVDALGNVIALKRGDQNGPKVMIAAHMDEIGFFISHIDTQTGFLRVEPVGGFDPRVLVAKRVVIHTESGPIVAAFGSTPIHILTEEERKKPLEIKNLFLDTGLGAEEVVEKIEVGDFVTLRQDFIEMGRFVSGKALDDRMGVFVMLEALKKLQSHKVNIYAVATTQEEVGLRGARVSAFGVSPDIGIALDTTIASDVPGTQEPQYVTQVGKGVGIKVKDSSQICHPKLVKRMKELAKSKNIPYQMEILPRGGTDAGALQMNKAGVAAITLSIPSRYVHSVVECVHKDDIKATIDLLAAFLETAHEVDLAL